MCVPAARFDDEEDEEDEPEENKRKDEFDFSMQGATAWLSSTYQATSLSDRDSRGDPDQISTCPHCHLALPLLTLRWHKVTFLHHTRFVYTWLKCSHGNSPPSLCVFRWSAESTFSWNKERESSSEWISCLRRIWSVCHEQREGKRAFGLLKCNFIISLLKFFMFKWRHLLLITLYCAFC